MNETSLVESRLGKLEQDNRHLKIALGVLLLLLVGMPLVGMTTPQQIPDVISAHEFHVVDGSGASRARMLIDRISYFDEDGTLRATSASDGIGYNDVNGTGRTWIDEYGIGYYGENGTLRLRMNSGGIVTADDNGIFRTRMSASGFAYYDENGDVIWSTAQDHPQDGSRD